jgi:hypothetical protein
MVNFSNALNLLGDSRLCDYFVFKKGMQPYELGKGNPPQTREMMQNKIYDAKIQHDASWQPLIKARNIRHYKIDWHGDWVKYGKHLAAPRDPEIFKGARILIQRIISSDKLAGCFTDEPLICNTDVISLIPKDRADKNILFFLGIILSRLCATYLKSRNVNLDRAVFPKINVNSLESFPIPPAIDAQKAAIIERVEKILAVTQQVARHENQTSEVLKTSEVFPPVNIPTLETEIDQLVYALYGLTADEIALVEGKR